MKIIALLRTVLALVRTRRASARTCAGSLALLVATTALPALAAQPQGVIDAATIMPAEPVDCSERLAALAKKHDVPGLAAVVVYRGTVVAQGHAGIRKRGDATPVGAGDLYHLGSDTKAMTATMIATLVQEGVLSWDTTVTKVFEAHGVTVDPGWSKVTLAHLLTNRGGAPADLRAGGLWAKLWERNGTPTEQRMQLVRGVVGSPPLHEPGTKFLYSNAGFAIAGAMAECVTGRAWEDLMRERLFTPLGMMSPGFGAPGVADSIDQPRGHTDKGVPVEPGIQADNPPAIGPAGTVHCSLEDWAKFLSLHARGPREGWTVDGRVLIPAAEFTLMHAPAPGTGKERYGFGWGIVSGPRVGEGALTHAGSNTMWYAVCTVSVAKDAAVLVACNQGGAKGTAAANEAMQMLIESHVAPLSAVVPQQNAADAPVKADPTPAK